MEKLVFGSGSTVRPYVKLPEETIVGVGAIVVKDFSERGLALIGNPAREMNKKKDRQSGVPAPFHHSFNIPAVNIFAFLNLG